MAARSTKRFKQKPAFPFGDFMLPLLCMLAIGIIAAGIRLLWAPSSPRPVVIPQPEPTVEIGMNNPSSSGITEDSFTVPADTGVVEDVRVARPLSDSSKKGGSRPVAVLPVRKVEPVRKSTPVVKPRPKPRPAPVRNEKRISVRGGSIDSSRFIVQCGSYSDRHAAESVASKLRRMGHTAIVRRVTIRGQVMHRVIVAGGSDRSVAEAVASDIKSTGCPVLVRKNK